MMMMTMMMSERNYKYVKYTDVLVFIRNILEVCVLLWFAINSMYAY